MKFSQIIGHDKQIKTFKELNKKEAVRTCIYF